LDSTQEVQVVDVIKRIFLVIGLVTVAAAQSPQPPLSDSRLSVNTLLREDIFAGLLADDMDRFSWGEKNIELLLEKRPAENATLLAWKALTKLYRAVRANEDGRADEFQQYYRQALDLFSKAREVGPNDGGVVAVSGGTYVVLADRLPKEYRAAAWSQAYDNYKLLWKFQASIVDKLPVHLRGELLAGLAQSAQRTGHTVESAQYVDKILAVLGNTPYESVAKKWKANPESAATTSLTCMTCHDAGRLSARVATLNGK
jgi:tetratricopeptide (TPR) repeat protein